jgi:hypothetical protein
MAHSDQSGAQDLGTYYSTDPRQLDMFGPPPAQTCDTDPAEVRAELMAVLAKARAAPQVPWDAEQASLYRTVFPQMASWLPADEAARLRREFAAELDRLQAA